VKHPLQTPPIEIFRAFQIIVYSFFATLTVIILSINLLPQTSLWKKIILQQKESREEGYLIDLTEKDLIGKIGKTITPLRPTGKAEISGKIWDVISDGDFIEEGKEIKVVSIEGNKIMVKLFENA
jgi:membrane-bound serine protease (ClpP class)